MDKKNITIIIALALVIVLIGYIVTDKIDICEQAKNDSYTLGYQQGTLFWNNIVIQTVNERNEIPYIFNNTIQALPITQICGGLE